MLPFYSQGLAAEDEQLMGMPILNFEMLLFLAPALILAVIAQFWIRSAYTRGHNIPATMSGYAAARRILDAAGLQGVEIEAIPGSLSDHYDPRQKVLRLSADNYHGRSLAAVGIAAHEAGHAIQDAVGYLPLVVRNLAVPAASFGSGASFFLLLLGFAFQLTGLILLGVLAFSAVVFFQLVNLPVEFNASNRAKALLVEEGIVNQYEMGPVNSVLNAAALTYVAATLQAVLQLLYFVLHFVGGRRDD
jgi:Zn-dependent membrane protease YugP